MKRTNKGFTLVELIIVIAILAIIMLIAIPNFSGIQQRMQVRADKATAAQIGKAVRVWFTDYTTDNGLKVGVTDGKYIPVANGVNHPGLPVSPASAVEYKDLDGIEGYMSGDQKPTSLKTANVTDTTQLYGVVLTAAATNTSSKIAVVITNKPDATITAVTVGTSANYDGSAPAVAYLEP